MIRPTLFLLLLVSMLVGLSRLHRPPPDVDMFARVPEGTHLDLSKLRFGELFAAKLAHGRAAPRYDIGVFGNSRSLMLGARELGAREGSFFNFSVVGGSPRAGVLLLEQLAKAGKAPRVALFSFDHAELQVNINPGVERLGLRLEAMLDDVTAGLASSAISPVDTLRMAWRHLYAAALDAQWYFNFEQVAAGLDWHAARWRGRQPWARLTGGASAHGYRRDGSHSWTKAPAGAVPRLARPSAPSVMLGYLEHDLERLAAVAARGTRIVMYESPLDPRSAAAFARRPSPHAEATRARWLAACAGLRLECHPFDARRMSAGGGWTDATHPPPALLAAYLRPLLQRRPAGRGTGRR